MRALCDMDTIQIELTNACVNSCSNCTRFCGHKTPFFMSKVDFMNAIDSMTGYPKMVGFMGGEPLLHPKFEEFCRFARSRIPKAQLGLWTCLPKGYEHYRETICETFDHIFVNDHTRVDIYHAPILVGAEEVFTDKKEMFYALDHCWLQNNWSASINPKGAYFCEIAASMSILYEEGRGWEVEPGWWWRTPKDFTDQIEKWCPRCGVALPFERRLSLDGRDDISPGHLEQLERVGSKKVMNGKYVRHNLQFCAAPKQMAAYKDLDWRNKVSRRYGIFQSVNEKNFLTPYLLKDWSLEKHNAAAEGKV